MQRTIEDIRLIDEAKSEEICQVLYENFALRWKEKIDRKTIEKILEKGLNLKNRKIDFNLKKFMQRNLETQKRAVLWMMDEHQMTAKQEIEILDLGIDPKKIECYKMSYQVGEWELLGGDVPDPINPSNIHFQLGVLTGWLEENKNSKEK
jgi:repressor of nif and glnA expression